MKKYLFMVDHKLRDLISISIIKKELERKGNKVFFCRNGMELPVALKKKCRHRYFNASAYQRVEKYFIKS